MAEEREGKLTIDEAGHDIYYRLFGEGPETLVGGSGRAITEVRPEGMVRVRGEDWRARSAQGVDAGHRVRVVGRDQLTLIVEPVE